MVQKINKSGLTAEENQQSIGANWQHSLSREAASGIIQENKTAPDFVQRPSWGKLSTSKKIEKLLNAGIKPEKRMRMGAVVSVNFPPSIGLVLNTKKDIEEFEEIRKKVLGIVD